jgi:integrase
VPEIVKKRVVPRTTDQVMAAAKVASDRLYAAVILAAGTGMRRSEVLGLTVDRVEFLRQKIVVDRQLVGLDEGQPVFGPPNTKTSIRTIPLAESVAKALAQHMEKYPPGTEGIVFTTYRRNPWRRETFGHEWKDRMDAAKLAGFAFHELRHYYASLLIRHGESVKTVQANLGHKSAEETLNTYAHLWEDADDRSRAAVHAALKLPSAESAPDYSRTTAEGTPYLA